MHHTIHHPKYVNISLLSLLLYISFDFLFNLFDLFCCPFFKHHSHRHVAFHFEEVLNTIHAFVSAETSMSIPSADIISLSFSNVFQFFIYP